MKQSRIVIAAAVVAVGVLFTAPTVATATPLTPMGSQALDTAVQHATAIDKVAVRHRIVRRGFAGHRGWRHGGWGRRGFARCWNCGGWRHRHWGSPFYFNYGYPYYGYGYPYGYPYYGYGGGPGIGFGFRIH